MTGKEKGKLNKFNKKVIRYIHILRIVGEECRNISNADENIVKVITAMGLRCLSHLYRERDQRITKNTVDARGNAENRMSKIKVP